MRKILVLLACAAVLSGCAPKSNIVSPDSTEGTVAGQPDFDAKDDVEIDWEQAKVDAEDIFTDTKEYPYSVDFHLLLQPEQKEIMLVWVVKDDLPSNQIAKYSEALVKGFNDMVATQDFSIERSSDTSYGGLWKTYGLSYGLAPESTQDDEDTWFISGSYPAGTDFKLPSAEEIQKAVDSVEAADAAETEAPEEEASGNSEEEQAEENEASCEIKNAPQESHCGVAVL